MDECLPFPAYLLAGAAYAGISWALKPPERTPGDDGAVGVAVAVVVAVWPLLLAGHLGHWIAKRLVARHRPTPGPS